MSRGGAQQCAIIGRNRPGFGHHYHIVVVAAKEIKTPHLAAELCLTPGLCRALDARPWEHFHQQSKAIGSPSTLLHLP